MSGRRLRPRPAASAAERTDAHYRKVADHLIDQIERGTASWTQAWQPGEKALPRNVATGKCRWKPSGTPSCSAACASRWH